jgi:hypothetical protein
MVNKFAAQAAIIFKAMQWEVLLDRPFLAMDVPDEDDIRKMAIKRIEDVCSDDDWEDDIAISAGRVEVFIQKDGSDCWYHGIRLHMEECDWIEEGKDVQPDTT